MDCRLPCVVYPQIGRLALHYVQAGSLTRTLTYRSHWENDKKKSAAHILSALQENGLCVNIHQKLHSLEVCTGYPVSYGSSLTVHITLSVGTQLWLP